MDGAETIAAVHAYLTESILPGLAQEQRSEFRAALKLLDEAAREVAERPALEAVDLKDAEERVLALQEQVRTTGEGTDELAELYATLGRHAEGRIPWQSIFPVPDRGSA